MESRGMERAGDQELRTLWVLGPGRLETSIP